MYDKAIKALASLLCKYIYCLCCDCNCDYRIMLCLHICHNLYVQIIEINFDIQERIVLLINIKILSIINNCRRCKSGCAPSSLQPISEQINPFSIPDLRHKIIQFGVIPWEITHSKNQSLLIVLYLVHKVYIL